MQGFSKWIRQIKPWANDTSPFVPQVWAQEAIMLLWQNMVMAQLVHRDFSNQIASFGDTVNTRKPAKFTATRKTVTDDVQVQDATAQNIAVKLDQHLHTSFLIRDGEESLSMDNLVSVYLEPAMRSLAVAVDQILTTQLYDFLPNMVGKLGTPLTKGAIIDAREFLNGTYCPLQGRNMVITPNTEGALLNISEFVQAQAIGDGGQTLRTGFMADRFGFSHYLCQNTPSLAALASTAVDQTYLINGAHAKGATTLTTKTGTTAITAGQWLTVAGDDTPQLVVTGGASNVTSVVITPGLKSAVAGDAVVTLCKFYQVNNGAGFALGYNKELTIDTLAVAAKLGQMISSGTGATVGSVYKYGVIGGIDANGASTPAATKIHLNRSLEAALVDDQKLFPGPGGGEYNFAFHRNALTFVSRPLAMPRAGTGAVSAIGQDGGVGIRVTITYNGTKQGHLVTVDLLAGLKTLDKDLGVVVLG